MLYNILNTDVATKPKKSCRAKPKSITKDADAPLKPNPTLVPRPRLETSPDGIPRSRKPRAIAAEQPEWMDMTAEEDTFNDMDLLFPIFHDSISNTVNKFRQCFSPSLLCFISSILLNIYPNYVLICRDITFVTDKIQTVTINQPKCRKHS